MQDPQQLLSSETIQMLVTSITQGGSKELSELEAERLLNAIARVQAGIPTGVRTPRNSEEKHN